MIKIDSYDPNWPALFDVEATNIRRVLGKLALRVEHVGSTAIPGLAAKPVVDIQVSVSSLGPMDTLVERLAHIGYSHVRLGAFDRVYPFFQKPADWPSTHHVHLCVVDSDQERNHLAFRDYLRSHPVVAAEYVALKRQLASSQNDDSLESQERYSLSKSAFVASVLTRALAPGRASTQLADESLAKHLCELEESLLLPHVRKSERLAGLLAEGFLEFGSSGRVYTKEDLVATLQEEVPATQTTSEFRVTVLAPNVALLTYRIQRHGVPPACTLRSSIWQLFGAEWKMVFHQGTLQYKET